MAISEIDRVSCDVSDHVLHIAGCVIGTGASLREPYSAYACTVSTLVGGQQLYKPGTSLAEPASERAARESGNTRSFYLSLRRVSKSHC